MQRDEDEVEEARILAAEEVFLVVGEEGGAFESSTPPGRFSLVPK